MRAKEFFWGLSVSFRLVKTGKSYAELGQDTAATEPKITAGSGKSASIPPIIWETGNIAQLRATLVWKEAEVTRLRAQLTGDAKIDWHARNQIWNLEGHIVNIKRWLSEAVEPKNDW